MITPKAYWIDTKSTSTLNVDLIDAFGSSVIKMK